MGNKTIKILFAVFFFIGVVGTVLYLYSNREINPTECTADKVGQLAKELYMLQHEKQICKDNLSALETLEDYNGVNDKCNQNDSLIEKKKIELGSAYEFEYMKIDMIISEMLMSKDIEKVEEVINSTGENETGTAFNTLMAILEEPGTPKKVE